MSWNFSRTPIYRSSANLLTVQPAGVDVVAPAEDPQHVAIQRRLLLSDEVLTRVLATLEQEHVEEADLGWLRKTLAVAPVEKTNLVALSAVGSKPSVLQRVVSVWIDNYLALQAERAAQETDRTHTELGQQQVALAQKIKEKRAELQGFRAEHDISSLDSADNEAHARLRGLNETLNRARERQVSADAALKAHREAAMTGGVVVPADQATELRKIELKVATLRSQQMELESKFKPAYIERDPELRKLPEQIRQLEDVIRRIKTNGQHEVVAKDGEAALAAHNEVMQLEAELVQNKRAANEFTARFAQHDAMRKELKQLEKLYDDNATRVARIELEHARRYPEYQIVDSPFLPQDPEGPAYGRDGGIVLGVALAMALFGAWLTEYLLRKPQEPQHALTGVRIYTGEGPNQLVHQVPAAPLLGRGNSPTGSRFLTGTPLDVLTDEREDRVLSTAELTAILRSAPNPVAQCVWLLLHGVTPEELTQLSGDALDLQAGIIQVPGPHGRRLPLHPASSRWFGAAGSPTGWRRDGRLIEGLNKALLVAAADVGITDPASVTAAAVRHTYILHLVQQGGRLGDLWQRVGLVDLSDLAKYASHSPPGMNLPLSEIDVIHPALRVSTDA